jgi:hypothetical protein
VIQSIDKQQLIYAQAAFTNLNKKLNFGDTVTQVVIVPAGHGDHWTYRAEITPTGPVFTDVALNTYMDDDGGQPMPYTQKVLKRLEFLELQAEVARPSGEREWLAVDLAQAVAVSVEQGSVPRGTTPGHPQPAEFQEGVWFSAIVPTGGVDQELAVLVQVELACAFRGSAADFDPPRAVEAAPFFAQIGVRAVPAAAWDLDPAGFRGRLVSFTGTVRLVGDVDTPAAMRQHMLDELFGTDGTPATADEQATIPTAPENYLGLFTDMWNLHVNALAPQVDVVARQLGANLDAFLAIPGAGTLAQYFRQQSTTTSVPSWLIRIGQALWIAFFEYVERVYPRRQPVLGQVPPAATSKAFVAVGQANDSKLDTLRRQTADVPWNEVPDGVLRRPLTKEPRQAAYDNMHLHGTMGTVGNISATDPLATPRVMAPGCGHSCFHAHWRWGNSTYFLSAANPAHPDLSVLSLVLSAAVSDGLVTLLTSSGLGTEDATDAVAAALWNWAPGVLAPPLSEKYLGWSSDGPNSRSNQTPGAPLIPPNQRLEIAVGPEPADVGQPLAAGALDPAVKTVDMVTLIDCADPYSPVWRHCTTEFAVGVAVRYTESAALELFRLWCYSYFLDRCYLPQALLDQFISAGMLPAGTTAYSPSRVFTDAYDVIPFLNLRDPATGDFDARRLMHATSGGTDQVVGITLEDM